MFVGHALLAFSLVAGAAGLARYNRRRALALGLAAGAFATVPDVDMAYALVGVAGAGTAPPLALASTFWATGNAVHRAVTHSLLVAPVAALAAAAWTAGRRGRRGAGAAGLGLLIALVAAAFLVSGPLAAAVMGLFGVALVGVSTLVARGRDGGRAVLAAALVGLASHPFGDLFTGTPPAFLYPLDVVLVPDRVALAADPTLHLLAAFGLELATAWLAVLVVARLSGVRVLPAPRAAAGVGYAAALPLLPAPTLDLSYPFVFGALAVGLLGLLPGAARGVVGTVGGRERGPSGGGRRRRLASLAAAPPVPSRAGRAALTALTAVTLAWAAYAATYLAL
ncbi:MAG: metal-dependent hydrolase [Haloferacaceae archaeon]